MVARRPDVLVDALMLQQSRMRSRSRIFSPAVRPVLGVRAATSSWAAMGTVPTLLTTIPAARFASSTAVSIRSPPANESRVVSKVKASGAEPEQIVSHLNNLKGYPGVFGDISFTPERHDGYPDDGIVMVEANSFKNGANHMAAVVLRGDSDKRAASMRIEMRRAFTHQIRCPEQSIRARRRLGGFLGPSMIGWVRQQSGSFSLALLVLAAAPLLACVLVLSLPRDGAIQD